MPNPKGRKRIPKRISDSLLQLVRLASPDAKTLRREIMNTCILDKQPDKIWNTNSISMVSNLDLTRRYEMKKKLMKQQGRKPKEIEDRYVFLLEPWSNVRNICAEGPCCIERQRHVLGDTTSGVHLNRNYDVLLRYLTYKKYTGVQFIVVFKVMFGKVKTVPAKLWGDIGRIEPTPNYDSHISAGKPEEEMGVCDAQDNNYIYVYEYDEDTALPCVYPSQILPFAVVGVVRSQVQLSRPLFWTRIITKTKSDSSSKRKTRKLEGTQQASFGSVIESDSSNGVIVKRHALVKQESKESVHSCSSMPVLSKESPRSERAVSGTEDVNDDSPGDLQYTEYVWDPSEASCLSSVASSQSDKRTENANQISDTVPNVAETVEEKSVILLRLQEIEKEIVMKQKKLNELRMQRKQAGEIKTTTQQNTNDLVSLTLRHLKKEPESSENAQPLDLSKTTYHRVSNATTGEEKHDGYENKEMQTAQVPVTSEEHRGSFTTLKDMVASGCGLHLNIDAAKIDASFRQNDDYSDPPTPTQDELQEQEHSFGNESHASKEDHSMNTPVIKTTSPPTSNRLKVLSVLKGAQRTGSKLSATNSGVQSQIAMGKTTHQRGEPKKKLSFMEKYMVKKHAMGKNRSVDHVPNVGAAADFLPLYAPASVSASSSNATNFNPRIVSVQSLAKETKSKKHTETNSSKKNETRSTIVSNTNLLTPTKQHIGQDKTPIHAPDNQGNDSEQNKYSQQTGSQNTTIKRSVQMSFYTREKTGDEKPVDEQTTTSPKSLLKQKLYAKLEVASGTQNGVSSKSPKGDADDANSIPKNVPIEVAKTIQDLGNVIDKIKRQVEVDSDSNSNDDKLKESEVKADKAKIKSSIKETTEPSSRQICLNNNVNDIIANTKDISNESHVKQNTMHQNDLATQQNDNTEESRKDINGIGNIELVHMTDKELDLKHDNVNNTDNIVKTPQSQTTRNTGANDKTSIESVSEVKDPNVADTKMLSVSIVQQSASTAEPSHETVVNKTVVKSAFGNSNKAESIGVGQGRDEKLENAINRTQNRSNESVLTSSNSIVTKKEASCMKANDDSFSIERKNEKDTLQHGEMNVPLWMKKEIVNRNDFGASIQHSTEKMYLNTSKLSAEGKYSEGMCSFTNLVQKQYEVLHQKHLANGNSQNYGAHFSGSTRREIKLVHQEPNSSLSQKHVADGNSQYYGAKFPGTTRGVNKTVHQEPNLSLPKKHVANGNSQNNGANFSSTTRGEDKTVHQEPKSSLPQKHVANGNSQNNGAQFSSTTRVENKIVDQEPISTCSKELPQKVKTEYQCQSNIKKEPNLDQENIQVPNNTIFTDMQNTDLQKHIKDNLMQIRKQVSDDSHDKSEDIKSSKRPASSSERNKRKQSRSSRSKSRDDDKKLRSDSSKSKHSSKKSRTSDRRSKEPSPIRDPSFIPFHERGKIYSMCFKGRKVSRGGMRPFNKYKSFSTFRTPYHNRYRNEIVKRAKLTLSRNLVTKPFSNKVIGRRVLLPTPTHIQPTPVQSMNDNHENMSSSSCCKTSDISDSESNDEEFGSPPVEESYKIETKPVFDRHGNQINFIHTKRKYSKYRRDHDRPNSPQGKRNRQKSRSPFRGRSSLSTFRKRPWQRSSPRRFHERSRSPFTKQTNSSRLRSFSPEYTRSRNRVHSSDQIKRPRVRSPSEEPTNWPHTTTDSLRKHLRSPTREPEDKQVQEVDQTLSKAMTTLLKRILFDGKGNDESAEGKMADMVFEMVKRKVTSESSEPNSSHASRKDTTESSTWRSENSTELSSYWDQKNESYFKRRSSENLDSPYLDSVSKHKYQKYSEKSKSHKSSSHIFPRSGRSKSKESDGSYSNKRSHRSHREDSSSVTPNKDRSSSPSSRSYEERGSFRQGQSDHKHEYKPFFRPFFRRGRGYFGGRGRGNFRGRPFYHNKRHHFSEGSKFVSYRGRGFHKSFPYNKDFKYDRKDHNKVDNSKNN